MTIDLPTPMVFAHRGACAFAPENTLAAFNLAIAHGADGIELDVKLSADYIPVVIHDHTVNRTTDGKGRVNQLTLTQLQNLNAGILFPGIYPGEKIPTLDDVFEEVGRKIFINVELTNYSSPGDSLVRNVTKCVEKHGLQNRILFSSFLPENLIQAKRHLPGVSVALLCLPGIQGWLNRSAFFYNISPDIIHPYLKDVDSSLIDREHKRMRRVHTWTVNDESEMRRLFGIHVDGIFTDDPKKARQVLEQQ